MSASRTERNGFRFVPGSVATYRLSGKLIGAILGLSILSGVLIRLAGYPLYSGMTVAMGAYLVLCAIVFITIPLILIDEFFD